MIDKETKNLLIDIKNELKAINGEIRNSAWDGIELIALAGHC